MANQKYGVASLRREFPDDASCLEFLFDATHTRGCTLESVRGNICGGQYKKVAGRRQFQCSKCRFQIAPTAGTIFSKSGTPLVLWFHAILVFFNAKGKISAKQLERDMEVTYKCAWRILGLIRGVLSDYPRLYTSGLAFSDVVAIVTQGKIKK